MVYYLVYVSSTITPLSRSELVDLLAKSRANNSRLGITGMLLYKDGNVMQVLEGQAQNVRALYAKISRDPRHKGLIVLIDGEADARQFPDWSMAYRDLSDAEVLAMPGYSEFLNAPLTGAEFASDPSRCQRLLRTFKQTM
jgi:FAD-dependent sensor of blue light